MLFDLTLIIFKMLIAELGLNMLLNLKQFIFSITNIEFLKI